MDTETKRGMSHGELLTKVINNPDVLKLARLQQKRTSSVAAVFTMVDLSRCRAVYL